MNSNAETGFPGIIGGEKLGAVIISLASIDHANVKLREHKKEGSFVTVPVSSIELDGTFTTQREGLTIDYRSYGGSRAEQ